MFPFCGYQLDIKLCCFITFTGKVYPDAINELQYLVAKMHTKSEMHVKYGHTIFLREILVHKQLINKKQNINEPQWSIFKTV